MRILVTTTSFQDTPGKHQDLLNNSGEDIVRLRGPIDEQGMLAALRQHGPFDGLLCGDDQITAAVIDAYLPQLRCISKYGIGLDSIDVAHATLRRVPVLFTPGVNETTVAEQTYGLLIAVAKHFWFHLRATKAGKWQRQTGTELFGKTLGVIGLGRVGREVIKRAGCFGMRCIVLSRHWDQAFAAEHRLRRADSLATLCREATLISLHNQLTPETRGMINVAALREMHDGTILVNTARGGLVVEADVAAACRSRKLAGYGADVLAEEPMRTPHPFDGIDNIIITPHIGSRTFESVQRQGTLAVNNLLHCLRGSGTFVQANPFPGAAGG